MSMYINFLKGIFWDKRMLDVEYDNVTVSLKENLLYGYVFLQNETAMIWNPKHSVTFRSSKRKCFTIDAPDMNQQLNWFFGIYINNDIFPIGRRPGRNDAGRFYTYLHFPGQRFTSYYTVKSNWMLRTNNSESYFMEFTIKNIDVITRRSKPKKRCFEDWKNYDSYIMGNVMTEAQCHPPHWIPTSNMPLCSNTTEMKKFISQPTTGQIEEHRPPCKVIERLDYEYEEADENIDMIRM